MNKQLFSKVKDQCKDTGLSEKHLKTITELLGGSIEDDSTDEAAIETAANLVVSVAKASQSEASRWANANKKPETEEEAGGEHPKKKPETNKSEEEGKDNPVLKELADLKKKLADMEASQSKTVRASDIAKAMEKHKIPAKFRERLAKSISDEEDIEAAVAAIKQDFITDGLMTDETEGAKGASEKQVDEAADSLLESITVK